MSLRAPSIILQPGRTCPHVLLPPRTIASGRYVTSHRGSCLSSSAWATLSHPAWPFLGSVWVTSGCPHQRHAVCFLPFVWVLLGWMCLIPSLLFHELHLHGSFLPFFLRFISHGLPPRNGAQFHTQGRGSSPSFCCPYSFYFHTFYKPQNTLFGTLIRSVLR